jgi:hypothetical protein
LILHPRYDEATVRAGDVWLSRIDMYVSISVFTVGVSENFGSNVLCSTVYRLRSRYAFAASGPTLTGPGSVFS